MNGTAFAEEQWDALSREICIFLSIYRFIDLSIHTFIHSNMDLPRQTSLTSWRFIDIRIRIRFWF